MEHVILIQDFGYWGHPVPGFLYRGITDLVCCFPVPTRTPHQEGILGTFKFVGGESVPG